MMFWSSIACHSLCSSSPSCFSNHSKSHDEALLFAVQKDPSPRKEDLSEDGFLDQDPLLKQGKPRKADSLQHHSVFLDAIKSCSRHKDLQKGITLHRKLIQQHEFLKRDVYINNALISMYAKCGSFSSAKQVLYEFLGRNVVSWNALISGYVEHRLGHDALTCFECMKTEGFLPNRVTFICCLKACIVIGSADKGEQMHVELRKQGLLETDVMLNNALVDMYMKCGTLAKAQEVFDESRARNVVTWNALISGYVQYGLIDEALTSFRWMAEECILPDAITFVCILKACGSIGLSGMGEEIHSKVCNDGLLRMNIVLATTLVDMYAKCAMLKKAQEVFDDLPGRNAISWNALIAGYAQSGHGDEALKCFKQMQEEGFGPDAITFSCILKSCGSVGLVEKGKEIHAEVKVQGLLERNPMVGTALVDMYAKFGLVDKAQEAFDDLLVRDVISWTSLIAGYAQHGFGHEALRCFKRMRAVGFIADAFTFACILKACGNMGSVEEGEKIHTEVTKSGLLKKSFVLASALMDMYIKCGAIDKAHELFDELHLQNVVLWNTLIAGYAQLGHTKVIFDLLNKMIVESTVPNDVTFLILLNACSHGGLLEEGQMYFDMMSNVYCITPTPEHYTCMVDLFSRAGHFDKAALIIEEVPSSDRLHMLRTFLSACQKSVNVELGRWAFECSLQLHGKSDSVYVCMSNIYAAAELQGKSNKLEALRMKNEAW